MRTFKRAFLTLLLGFTAAAALFVVWAGASLPPAREVAIQGGSHAGSGCYGTQPGDAPAAIRRASRQNQLRRAALEALAELH